MSSVVVVVACAEWRETAVMHLELYARLQSTGDTEECSSDWFGGVFV